MYTTYSFTDLAGALILGGSSYTFSGQEGVGGVTISMDTDKTEVNVAADGGIMGSFIPGDSGKITIEVQQTSDLHAWLVARYNTLKTTGAATWLTGVATFRNVVDGSKHVCQGVTFQKLPDKQYKAAGQTVTWVLPAMDIQTI
jgi:hypothetical protein